MKNHQFDVTLQSAGVGVASLRDLAAAMDIVVVSIPTDVIKMVNDAAYLAALLVAAVPLTDDWALRRAHCSLRGISSHTQAATNRIGLRREWRHTPSA